MSEMYTILINEDHSFTHTKKKRIMQRSSNIDTIRFLVNPTYNNLDMMQASTIVELRMPISHKYIPITLSPSAELYKNKVEFLLPLDLSLTKEAGELELTIKFSNLEMDENGEFIEIVRTIGLTSITIHEIVNWSDYIPSADMDNIVQIMLKNQSLLEQQNENINMMNAEKADGIAKDETTNEIYLTSNGVEIGTRIKDSDTCLSEDGVPVVDFTVIKPEEPEANTVNNVVEF